MRAPRARALCTDRARLMFFRAADFCFGVAIDSLLRGFFLYVRVPLTFYVIAAGAVRLRGLQLGLAMTRVCSPAVPVGLGRNLLRAPTPVQQSGLKRRHQGDLAGKVRMAASTREIGGGDSGNKPR